MSGTPAKIDLVALYMLNAKRTYRLSLDEARLLGGWTDMRRDAAIAIRAVCEWDVIPDSKVESHGDK